jgi:hypothetical protein
VERGAAWVKTPVRPVGAPGVRKREACASNRAEGLIVAWGMCVMEIQSIVNSSTSRPDARHSHCSLLATESKQRKHAKVLPSVHPPPVWAS